MEAKQEATPASVGMSGAVQDGSIAEAAGVSSVDRADVEMGNAEASQSSAGMSGAGPRTNTSCVMPANTSYAMPARRSVGPTSMVGPKSDHPGGRPAMVAPRSALENNPSFRRQGRPRAAERCQVGPGPPPYVVSPTICCLANQSHRLHRAPK